MSAKICQCCGQPLPSNYAGVALNAQLTRSQTVVFLAVAEANGRLVTMDHLIDLLWGMDPDGGPMMPINVIRAFIHHSNPKLKSFGLKIENVWGQGYRLCAGPLTAEVAA